MAIPDFQSVMHPVMNCLTSVGCDGQRWHSHAGAWERGGLQERGNESRLCWWMVSSWQT